MTTDVKGHKVLLGVDIGGSGIKGAPVDLTNGKFVGHRERVNTPKSSTPEAIVDIVRELCDQYEVDGPVGVTFPGVVQDGITKTAANVDDSWIDFPAQEVLRDVLGRNVYLLNDADAAGVAESTWGAGRHVEGLVIMSTLGTGIGSALILDGELIPNSELGHLKLGKKTGEEFAANSVREEKNLSWEEWAERLTEYYRELEKLLWPELIIVGGGVSKKADNFLPLVDIRSPIVAAELRNAAGISGAAAIAGYRESQQTE